MENLEARMLLAANITADITNIAPDPHNAEVASISIVFSEAVENFAVADLVLQRGGTGVDLTGATLNTADDITWTLDDLPTQADGSYTLTLTDTGATIQSKTTGTNTMDAAAVTEAWVLDTTAPTATITLGAAPANTSIGNTATIVFSEAVTGFDLTQIKLTRGGTDIPLAGPAVTVATADNITFTLTGLAGKAGAVGSYTLTIAAAGTNVADSADNAIAADITKTWSVAAATPVVSVVATDAAATEAAGNGGTFTLYRTGPIDQTLTVKVAMGGSARNGKDYTAIEKTVTFAANSATATVSVATIDDTDARADKTAILSVTSGSGYTVDKTKAKATVTIADTAPVVTIEASGDTTEGGANATFTVTRTGSTAAPLTVNVRLTGSAKNGRGYAAIEKTVVIAAGSATGTLTIDPSDDGRAKGEKSVTATVRKNRSYFVGDDAAATIKIADIASTVSIVAADAAATEAAGNTGAFTISRGDDTTGDLVVKLLIRGTAKNGADYETIAKTVTILDGQKTVTVTVTPTPDAVAVPEAAETVIVSLAKASTYYIDDTKATATVTIADSSPIVSIAATDATGATAGPNTLEFTVTRNGTVGALPVTLTFAGKAKNGIDYDTDAVNGVVTIPDGVDHVHVTVTPKDDGMDEGNLSVILGIKPLATYFVTPTSATAIGTIDDA